MWILGILVVIIIYEISQNFKNYSIGMPRTAKRQASLIKGPIGSNGRWRVIFLLSKSTSRLLFYIKDKIPLTAGDRGYRTRSINEIQKLYLYWSIFYSSLKKIYIIFGSHNRRSGLTWPHPRTMVGEKNTTSKIWSHSVNVLGSVIVRSIEKSGLIRKCSKQMWGGRLLLRAVTNLVVPNNIPLSLTRGYNEDQYKLICKLILTYLSDTLTMYS